MKLEKFAKPLFDKWLPLNIQFFAEEDDDGGDDSDDNDEDGDGSTDELSLNEMLKDPAFKKQYNARLKEQLGKRMKKYEGVDPEEFRRLKEQADNKDSDDDKKADDKDKQLSEREKRIERAEMREKRAAVKEFAVENGHNPKLLSRLIDVNALELDDKGEPINLDELFEEIEEEFPDYFGQQNEEEEEPKKKKGYIPGSHQKGNNNKKSDPRARGAERARQRYKKED